MSTNVTTEAARANVVSNIEALIAERDAERPPEGTPGHAVHEFGTAMLRHELVWARGVRLPFELLQDGQLVEVESYGSHG